MENLRRIRIANIGACLFLALCFSAPTTSANSNPPTEFAASFKDESQAILSHARRLIEKNETEGAALDRTWYFKKRFTGKEAVVLGADNILFFGGRESEVVRFLTPAYRKIDLIENDREPGDVRMFLAYSDLNAYDLILIGPNGYEVALKTAIRLTDFFNSKFIEVPLKFLMSTRSPEEEYLDFFARHHIADPDLVLMGFNSNNRALLKAAGASEPRKYSDETLKVNWYENFQGKNIILISIDKDRIYASRAGQLIRAILKISQLRAPTVVFLGSAGALDRPDLIGKIIKPASVCAFDPFSESVDGPIYLIDNKANGRSDPIYLHTSIENVIIETFDWVKTVGGRGILTVDQELLHVVKALRSASPKTVSAIYAGILVTDNAASVPSLSYLTLQQAEGVIEKTESLRMEFLRKILTQIGILKPPAVADDSLSESAAGGG